MIMEMATTTNTANSAATGVTTTTIGGVNTTGSLSIIQPAKSPEAESETPPRIQPAKAFSFTNGVLKRHKHHHHHHTVVVGGVAYKECLKNHAASLGGHALDGCGEFMPAPTATATDPTSLKCAACGCHRNFHRREPDEVGGGGTVTTHVIEYHPQHRHHPLPPPGAHLSAPPQSMAPCPVRSPDSDNDSPPPISSTYYPGSAPRMLLALSSGGGSPDEPNKIHPIATTIVDANTNGNSDFHHHQIMSTSAQNPSRKRHRTKFRQDQKDKMYELAEKLGWKMQRSNEDLVNGFCSEIGVERGVFKVWMHNNKNTLGKRSAANYGINGGGTTGGGINHNHNHNHEGGGISIDDINQPIDEDDQHVINGNGVSNSHSSSISNNDNNHHQQHHGGRSVEVNAVPTNASSCSS